MADRLRQRRTAEDAPVTGGAAPDGPPGDMIKTAELTCPGCAEVVFPGEDFCEACGHRLTEEAGAASEAAPGTAGAGGTGGTGGTAGTGASCVGCGTGTIDADGYCERCGLRQPAERDHVEIELAGRVAAGASDRGRRYSRNEDAMTLTAHSGGVAVVVSDGVGSSPRPDEASRAAADHGAAELVARLESGTAPDAAMRAAVAKAAGAVAALAESPDEAPSCTFVSAVTVPGSVTVGWVGDSRAYWLSSAPAESGGSPLDTLDPVAADPVAASKVTADKVTADKVTADKPGLGASRALTADDSWAAYMIAEGALTEAEAEAHPNAHVITGWLGADAEEIRPHVGVFVADPGTPGTVLVCSDGLWNYLPAPGDLTAVLAEASIDPAADPLGAARALVRRALDAGGRDNITVAVIPLPPPSTPTPNSSSDMEHER